MSIRPLNDRVIIQPVEAEQKSAGGIIIPDTAKEKPSEGVIIAVGPGGRDAKGHRIKLSVEKGDRVLYGKWSGTELKVEGKDVLIVQEGDILCVLDGKAVVHAKGGKVAAAGGTSTGHVHVPGMDCC
jgi:chaperonin GroES